MYKYVEVKKDGRGRPQGIIDPKQLEEAAKNAKAFTTIAADLDISPRSLRDHMNAEPELEMAYAKGRAHRAGWIQSKIDDVIEKNPKSAVLLLLAAANQRPEQGGLGWQREDTRKIEVDVTLRPVDLAWDRRRKILEAERKKADEGVVLVEDESGAWAVEPETGTEN